MDNDGDLDLLLGNSGANRLYANDGAGNLTSAWISDEVQMTEGAAWGDWDGDGDLDLAVANHDQPNRLYENVGSTLSLTPIWASNQAERSWDLAWGDADNDGDLDLAVADFDHLRLYENTGGSLDPDPGWVSDPVAFCGSVDWGDGDGDGDLDLAVGCGLGTGQANSVFENSGGTLTALPV